MRSVGFAVLLLCVALVSAGCLHLGTAFDAQRPEVQRIAVRSGSEEATFPGVKATWAVRPEVDNPLMGLTTPGAIKEWSPLFMPDAPAPSPPRALEENALDSSASPEPPARIFRRAHHTRSFDLDYANATNVHGGDFLNSQQKITVRGADATGPLLARYRYDLHVGSLSLRTGVRFAEFFSIEGLAGLSIVSLGLQVTAGDLVQTQTLTAYGGHIGTRLTFTPHRLVDLYGQFQSHFLDTRRRSEHFVGNVTVEAGGKLHLTPNLSAYAAWRLESYRRSIHKSSNISISGLSGASLGAQLRF